jgi:hypothetical protein
MALAMAGSVNAQDMKSPAPTEECSDWIDSYTKPHSLAVRHTVR